MLQQITWAQYITVITILLVIYYGMYIYKYYLGNLNNLLNKAEENPDEEIYGFQIDDEKKQAEELLNQLEVLVNRIRTGILEKAGTEATKEQLLTEIAQVVVSFGGLSQPAYQHALNNYIIEHAIRICGVEISEEDLEQTWNDLPRLR